MLVSFPLFLPRRPSGPSSLRRNQFRLHGNCAAGKEISDKTVCVLRLVGFRKRKRFNFRARGAHGKIGLRRGEQNRRVFCPRSLTAVLAVPKTTVFHRIPGEKREFPRVSGVIPVILYVKWRPRKLR